jgi:hypothetical protein
VDVLKTATIILVIAMLFSGAYSLLIVFAPQRIAESTLEARTGKVLADVQDPGVAGTIVVQTRHMGVFALCISIAMFFVLLTGFRKGEKWAWWAFLLVGGIAWGYGLIMQIIEKDMFNLILHSIGMVLFLFGLLLPAKIFLAKKA